MGNACPITEITPEAPAKTTFKAKSSSPDIIKKSLGLFLINSKYCCTLFPASFTAIILEKSVAKRMVVEDSIFLEVLPGTLYRIIGFGLANAMALKC